jgi:hypothetical protein
VLRNSLDNAHAPRHGRIDQQTNMAAAGHAMAILRNALFDLKTSTAASQRLAGTLQLDEESVASSQKFHVS